MISRSRQIIFVRKTTSTTRIGLTYVTDKIPGIRRLRAGRGFRYVLAKCRPLRPEEIQRIRSLAIPPAWRDVWICADCHGHLQATGRDSKGRKQYLYHPAWSESRSESKYSRLLAFGRQLGRLRRRVARDLRRPGLPRDKVIATVVRLLDRAFLRIGNDEYVQQNGSYGVTTLEDRHVKINGASVRFRFKGKSGVEQVVDVHDRRLALIVRGCRDLPGQELFQYLDENGRRRRVKSDDINRYLRTIMGESFTAKDFRTWAGTVLMAKVLKDVEPVRSAAQLRRTLVKATDLVAKRLGNTIAVCRKSYIHPIVLEAYQKGTLSPTFTTAKTTGRLSQAESCVLTLLRRQRMV